MFTACISNIVLWFVLHVSGQYWSFVFTSINSLTIPVECRPHITFPVQFHLLSLSFPSCIWSLIASVFFPDIQGFKIIRRSGLKSPSGVQKNNSHKGLGTSCHDLLSADGTRTKSSLHKIVAGYSHLTVVCLPGAYRVRLHLRQNESNAWPVHCWYSFVQPLDLRTASPWRSPFHVVFFSVDSSWNCWLSGH